MPACAVCVLSQAGGHVFQLFAGGKPPGSLPGKSKMGSASGPFTFMLLHSRIQRFQTSRHVHT